MLFRAKKGCPQALEHSKAKSRDVTVIYPTVSVSDRPDFAFLCLKGSSWVVRPTSIRLRHMPGPPALPISTSTSTTDGHGPIEQRWPVSVTIYSFKGVYHLHHNPPMQQRCLLPWPRHTSTDPGAFFRSIPPMVPIWTYEILVTTTNTQRGNAHDLARKITMTARAGEQHQWSRCLVKRNKRSWR